VIVISLPSAEWAGRVAGGDVMQQPSFGFPSTHWSRLGALDGAVTADHRRVIEWLSERYWKPVYVYFLGKGVDPEKAQDLTQEFFVHALGRALFDRADQARGRFRDFLLSCLKHFLIDQHRRRETREKIAGTGPCQDIGPDGGNEYEPKTDETPEDAFHRTWVAEMLKRVWADVQVELKNNGMEVHAALFQQRVYDPATTGTTPAALDDLAEQYGLSCRQASNRIMTVVRAFRRRLTAEIQQYASTKQEVDSELRDLFRFAAA
jgi:RNA polymerase sigma-70 factor (ECF subfamily)